MVTNPQFISIVNCSYCRFVTFLLFEIMMLASNKSLTSLKIYRHTSNNNMYVGKLLYLGTSNQSWNDMRVLNLN